MKTACSKSAEFHGEKNFCQRITINMLHDNIFEGNQSVTTLSEVDRKGSLRKAKVAGVETPELPEDIPTNNKTTQANAAPETE